MRPFAELPQPVIQFIKDIKTCDDRIFPLSSLQSLPQLPLLLQHLQLQPLDAIPQRLLALPHRPRPQLVLAVQLPAAPQRLHGLVGPREAALLQLAPRLERLDAPLLALDLGVGAGEEEGDVWADVVAQGGFGGGEGRLGDEFVVLKGG